MKTFFNKVLATRTPLFVTQSKGEEVVVLSKSDYESMQETLYLLSSTKNVERLERGLEEYKLNKGVKRDLID